MRKFKIISLSMMFVLCIGTLSLANSIDTLITAANSGDANAMYELGRAYQKGDGVAKSDAEAAKWFTKAAELDHPRALFSLGYMYSEGIGVKYNTKKAYLYYKRAADLGNPAAMNNLGVMYHIGESISKDMSLATQWYQKASKLGCNDAVTNLDRIERNSSRAYTVRRDDEYYNKGKYVWHSHQTGKNINNGEKDNMHLHTGFDIAKTARSRDGYMIISSVSKDSEAAKGGLLEGCDLFQVDNMNTKQFSQTEISQYILKSAEKKATIMIVFMSEDGATKRLDIKLK